MALEVLVDRQLEQIGSRTKSGGVKMACTVAATGRPANLLPGVDGSGC